MKIKNFDEAQWLAFVEQCKACTRCSLCESRQNVVVYRGAVPAPLMIIGEGPGQTEDEQGKPFVGRSGQLLSDLLTAFSFSEADYHIANIVKCRPPGNRVPTWDEVKACRPLLQAQFLFNKPRYVLLMGATAYKYFTGDKTSAISRVRGRFIERDELRILPAFHPAYVLRDPRRKTELWQDIKLLREAMEAEGLLRD